ncbi:NAD(P)H-dependent oxidoreductase [Salibacterium salarium]|nr:NAD(P)H-dependent oxidoreductase [Salibacterium salarium]
MKLLGISGTITGSKTKTSVRQTLDMVKRHDPNIEVEFMNLKDYDLQFCDGRDPWTYRGIHGASFRKWRRRVIILSASRFFRDHLPGLRMSSPTSSFFH